MKDLVMNECIEYYNWGESNFELFEGLMQLMKIKR